GEKAYLFIRWREGRFSTAKPAMCAGLRYAHGHVVDTKVKAGEGWFGLGDRNFRVHLTITSRLSVFKNDTQIGPPICVETNGTWSGVGREGTFLFNNDETLT